MNRTEEELQLEDLFQIWTQMARKNKEQWIKEQLRLLALKDERAVDKRAVAPLALKDDERDEERHRGRSPSRRSNSRIAKGRRSRSRWSSSRRSNSHIAERRRSLSLNNSEGRNRTGSHCPGDESDHNERKYRDHHEDKSDYYPKCRSNGGPSRTSDVQERSNRAGSHRPEKPKDDGRSHTSDVPGFFHAARGTPYQWNYRITEVGLNQIKEENSETASATPDIYKFVEFLKKRHVSDKLGLPKKSHNGWFVFQWRNFDDSKLSTKSEGRFASETNGNALWQTAWHGCKMEAIYSIIWHGKIFASSKGLGQRMHRNNLPGVYCSPHAVTADRYARLTPLFGDGIWWQAKWELQVDRTHRTPNNQLPANQWLQPESSVELQRLWVRGLSREDIIQNACSSTVAMNWNPLFEANPRTIVKQLKVSSEPSQLSVTASEKEEGNSRKVKAKDLQRDAKKSKLKQEADAI